MNDCSCENFVLLWVLAEEPLLEIVYGEAVVLCNGVAIGIVPLAAVYFGCYGVVVGVVAQFYGLYTYRIAALCYLDLWRVVGLAGPLADGEGVIALLHLLGIVLPLVVVPTDGVFLLP